MSTADADLRHFGLKDKLERVRLYERCGSSDLAFAYEGLVFVTASL
jgi:hypothetical protein